MSAARRLIYPRTDGLEDTIDEPEWMCVVCGQKVDNWIPGAPCQVIAVLSGLGCDQRHLCKACANFWGVEPQSKSKPRFRHRDLVTEDGEVLYRRQRGVDLFNALCANPPEVAPKEEWEAFDRFVNRIVAGEHINEAAALLVADAPGAPS